MEQPKRREFTADEFIAWALEQPSGRFELSNGVVVAMSPERANHSLAKFDAAVALRDAIRAGGLDCQVFPDGMSVRVDKRTVYEPDALVRCGPRTPGDAVEATDPVIVVEVISPSSRGVDSGAKLLGYFSLPSVRHYLVIDTERRAIVRHSRGAGGLVDTRFLHEGTLTLDPPGIAIEVADVFASL